MRWAAAAAAAEEEEVVVVVLLQVVVEKRDPVLGLRGWREEEWREEAL